MRTARGCAAVAAILSAIIGCDSSTAPASCSNELTRASYVREGALPSDAVITGIKLKSGTAVGGASSRTQIDYVSRSNSTLTGQLFVDDATAIFTQHDSEQPHAASACTLAVGQSMTDFVPDFGDVLLVPGDPVPAVTQIVIEH